MMMQGVEGRKGGLTMSGVDEEGMKMQITDKEKCEKRTRGL